MIAYLSGAMEHAEHDGADWRQEITQWLAAKLGHEVIDPVIESKKIIKNFHLEGYRDWKQSDPLRFKNAVRKMIDHDLKCVQEADYLIVLWNQNVLLGGGTHGEVTMAYHSHIPVYIVNRLPMNELSGWILSCSKEIIPDFESLKQCLLTQYA